MAAAKDILIIEDDKDLAESIRIILESKDHNVRIAYNAMLGFKEIQKSPPELILLDIMMATDTEGFDLAFKLKKDPLYQKIPIIIMTSFLKKVAEDGPDRFQHVLNITRWTICLKWLEYFRTDSHLLNDYSGEVSEWLKEPVSKTGVPFGVPRVRIPPSPLKVLTWVGGMRTRAVRSTAVRVRFRAFLRKRASPILEVGRE